MARSSSATTSRKTSSTGSSGKTSRKSTAGTQASGAKASRASLRSRSRKTSGTASAVGARPLWSGNLRLALVSVPVKIFAATRSGARISFHQVHRPTEKRVRYEKVVPGVGPVDLDEIVKGYELDKGRYVLIDPQEIEDLKLETKKTLDLIQFVRQGEIDPIWFDRPYYVVADGDLAEEAYGVLRDALRSSHKIGLGQFVMRGREYIGAVKPCGNGLLLETLRFADEVTAAAPFFAGIDADDPDPELLSLAEELIERKTAPFDPSRFKDDYTEAVRALIEAKVKRRKLTDVDEGEEEPARGGGKVIDLVEALKRSVRSADKPGGEEKPKRSGAGSGAKKTSKAAGQSSRRKAG